MLGQKYAKERNAEIIETLDVATGWMAQRPNIEHASEQISNAL